MTYSTTQACSSCFKPYQFDSTNKTCLKNSIKYCKTGTDTTCTECVLGYQISTATPNTCEAKVKNAIDNCLLVSLDGTYCVRCAAGFVRSNIDAAEGSVIGAKCVEAKETGCLSYNDDGTCKTCLFADYYLDATTKKCVAANIPFCTANQEASVDATCTKCCTTCADGFGLYTYTVDGV